jgi:LmbE family N-acetylglucosaminyl deacetylase
MDAGRPLPVDTGDAGLKEMLRRLGTTARLMQTVAHPDDEDGGMLTFESRGKGTSVVLMTLTRGEGGQNKLGSNLFDVLGVLRTLELLASDRYYGVEQRFSRVADFGFSKTADETIQKWGGHDVALGDIVRVIRTFRPDVLVARFSGTERDGHGNHQASAILTREAFRAAADPKRFPEQLQEGLQPWQAKKFYIGNVCGFGASSCPDENYTLRLNVGVNDPVIGMSPVQFAMNGLRHQLSQGAGAWTVDPGDRFTFYKLVDSVIPAQDGALAHEKDFFDGIDTTLPGLAARLGNAQSSVPYVRPDLEKIQAKIDEARKVSDGDSSRAAQPLLQALAIDSDVLQRLEHEKALNPAAKSDLVVALRTKQEQLQQAVNLALKLGLAAEVETPVAATPESAFMAVPGQTFKAEVSLHNGGKEQLIVGQIALEAPKGWKATEVGAHISEIPPGKDLQVHFQVTVAEDAEYTRPYWHRTNPETESLNTIDEARYVTLPFPPPPLSARVNYTAGDSQGLVSAVVTVPFKDTAGRAKSRALAVAPAFSVSVDPSSQVIPLGRDGASPIVADVRSQLLIEAGGALHVKAPQGWRVEPANEKVELAGPNESKKNVFQCFADGDHEGQNEATASLEARNKSYAESFSVVTRDDLDTFYYYQPAVQRISIVSVKVPAGLKVGYIMGAGDTIPEVLRQLGIDVTVLPAENLSHEDLSRFGTIVLGIRAYDTQKDVGANNQRLLDFVAAGGTLVVQYNASVGDFNSGKFTPYPAQLSRARVSVEEAPVDVLAPTERVLHYPNEITHRDFDGWVQERGLYFLSSWDSKFTPLLSSQDPGESPQKGGLVIARYEKGTYIYTGYAFFRQLPAGVPGAVRLYVNLLAAGH